MTANCRHEMIERIGAPRLVFAALFATMLSLSNSGHAQPIPAQAASASAPAKLAPRVQSSTQSGLAAGPSGQQPKGNREGIKVHGHWTIEVRNLDGKLVTHREFENGLFNLGIGQGGTLLAAFLGRVLVPGGWYVLLSDAADRNGDLIIIAELNSQASVYCTNTAQTQAPPIQACSTTPLSITAPALVDGAYTPATLTFQGSAVIPQGFPSPGQGFSSAISYVETDNLVCAQAVSPQTCFAPNDTSLPIALTARNLDGQGDDPAPVSVSPLQTVTVTVVISFSSGN